MMKISSLVLTFAVLASAIAHADNSACAGKSPAEQYVMAGIAYIQSDVTANDSPDEILASLCRDEKSLTKVASAQVTGAQILTLSFASESCSATLVLGTDGRVAQQIGNISCQ